MKARRAACATLQHSPRWSPVGRPGPPWPSIGVDSAAWPGHLPQPGRGPFDTLASAATGYLARLWVALACRATPAALQTVPRPTACRASYRGRGQPPPAKASTPPTGLRPLALGPARPAPGLEASGLGGPPQHGQATDWEPEEPGEEGGQEVAHGGQAAAEGASATPVACRKKAVAALRAARRCLQQLEDWRTSLGLAAGGSSESEG